MKNEKIEVRKLTKEEYERQKRVLKEFVKEMYAFSFTPKKIFPKFEKGKVYFISKDEWIAKCVNYTNLPEFLSLNDFKTLCKDLIQKDYDKELRLAKGHAKEYLENEKQELVMKK